MDHKVCHCFPLYFEIRLGDLKGHIGVAPECEAGLAIPDSRRAVDTFRLQVPMVGFKAKCAGKAWTVAAGGAVGEAARRSKISAGPGILELQ